MDTTTIAQPTRPSTRELRGIALYEEHKDEIRFERGVWVVPSLSEATTVYEVRIGTRAASCECADHCYRGVPCMHVHAATIAKAKTRTCAACSGRFRGRDLFEVGEDDLTFFEGDVLCRGLVRPRARRDLGPMPCPPHTPVRHQPGPRRVPRGMITTVNTRASAFGWGRFSATGENLTNATRHFVRDLDMDNEYERGRPCAVRHRDAGGWCHEPASVKMYDMLNFCEGHGEEARIGALMEAYRDAAYFFDRFRNPHTPDLNAIVEAELEAAVDRMRGESPSDDDHYRALRRAYPDTPEYVREIVVQWGRDEEANGGPSPLDLLLDSLYTILKLMRLAHEDREDWLVEILEHQRQEMAARAAYALEVNDRRTFVEEERRRRERDERPAG